MKKLLTLCILLLLAAESFSQAPSAFSYQAVARDSSGAVLTNQRVGLRITLYDPADSLLRAYTETHAQLTNAYGLLNVEIGRGRVVRGSFDSLNWSKGSYFIEVEIDHRGGSNYQDLGMSQLLSVPYALYAERTKQTTPTTNNAYWRKKENDISFAEGKVGIGTNEPSTVLEVFDHSNQAFSVFRDSNKLLYGTSIWFKLLDNQYNKTSYAKITGGIQDNTFDAHDGFLSFQVASQGSFDSNYSQEKMRITADGSIGIGTHTPKSKLHISEGDVYLDAIDSGIIMKSPKGACWRVTVDDQGNFVSTAVSCP